jgi:hypothetical protein
MQHQRGGGRGVSHERLSPQLVQGLGPHGSRQQVGEGLGGKSRPAGLSCGSCAASRRRRAAGLTQRAAVDEEVRAQAWAEHALSRGLADWRPPLHDGDACRWCSVRLSVRLLPVHGSVRHPSACLSAPVCKSACLPARPFAHLSVHPVDWPACLPFCLLLGG